MENQFFTSMSKTGTLVEEETRRYNERVYNQWLREAREIEGAGEIVFEDDYEFAKEDLDNPFKFAVYVERYFDPEDVIEDIVSILKDHQLEEDGFDKEDYTNKIQDISIRELAEYLSQDITMDTPEALCEIEAELETMAMVYTEEHETPTLYLL